MIGGGTGTSVVITGLKLYAFDISAVVSVADSGGSTGRLRDEFGFLPVGDLRQALSALAVNAKESWIRDLLLYRFDRGSGLEGHNLGNLILTALQDMTGSTAKAINIASQIFRLTGHIYPSTLQAVDLVIEYSDGTFMIGEHHLNPGESGGHQIKRVRLSPRAALYPPAKQALLKADLIIIGPGDLYASLLPNLLVSGMKPTLTGLKTPLIYIMNLMTTYAQTHQFSATKHLQVIEAAVGRSMDYCIVNSAPLPPLILEAYHSHHEYPVIDDLGSKPGVIRAPLIHAAQVKRQVGDRLNRSFLRHDPISLAQVIIKILNQPVPSQL